MGAAVHPSMLTGDTIKVCNKATRADFSSDGAYNAFTAAFDDAVAKWNSQLHVESSVTTGTPHKIFEGGSTVLCDEDSFDIHVYRGCGYEVLW